MSAEHVVLHARDVGNIDTRPQKILRGLLGLGENRIRLELFVVGRADHQRPTDLGVVAVHLRGELGGDTVAGLELAPGGRLHAGHFGTAGGDQHEVIFGAVGLEKGFDLGDQLVLGHPGLAHLDELLVAAVGEVSGFPHPLDLFGSLDAADLLDIERRGHRSCLDAVAYHLHEARFHMLHAVDGHDRRLLLCKQCIQSVSEP